MGDCMKWGPWQMNSNGEGLQAKSKDKNELEHLEKSSEVN